MTRAPVQWSELEVAFEFVGAGRPFEHEAWVRLETGEIVWHSDLSDLGDDLPEDLDDEGRYLAIPHPSELGLGSGLARRFASLQLPDEADEVERIFGARGAFRRFRELLESRDQLEAWHQFERTERARALREWCEENQVEIREPEA